MNELKNNMPEQSYFLSDLLGKKVSNEGKKLGKLADLVARENGVIPFVTYLYVQRPLGYPSLLIPWENVLSLSNKEIVIKIDNVEKYVSEPSENAILLNDYIMDKKVLDVANREVDVVYDLKLVMRNNRLYVSDVDFSRHRLLKRIGLGFLADQLYEPEETRHKEVSWTHIQPLSNVSSFKGEIKLDVLKEKLSELKPVDFADVLEEMDHEQRVAIFDELETDRASDVLEEISPNVQRALITSLKKEKVVKLIDAMTPGQAADVLSVLPVPDKETILKALDKEKAIGIRSILERHSETVLNYATRNFILVSPDETVLEVQEKYHIIAKGKEVVMYLYVVDEQGKLLGVIDIMELLKADPKAKLKEIMICNIIRLKPESTLKDASLMFSRYNFRAIPITDGDHKLIGVVPFRDVMNLKHIFFE